MCSNNAWQVLKKNFSLEHICKPSGYKIDVQQTYREISIQNTKLEAKLLKGATMSKVKKMP